MLILGIWILVLAVGITKPECSTRKLQWEKEYFVHCTKTNFENFLYEFLQNNDSIEYDSQFRHYSLVITNSQFERIHSFLLPYPKDFRLRRFALTNSLVEFIEDEAFEELVYTTDLALSNNKLHDISFVSTLPTNLEKLFLDGNYFETISDVFGRLYKLNYLDLSNCKISTIYSNSFSTFHSEIFISVRNNSLTSFDVFFADGLKLEIDLSLNNIKYIDSKARRIYFRSLNASHNQIQNISDISCQDCGYSYYRRTINFIDLSFNDLNSIKVLNSFTGVKLENLNLSNSNIDANFDFDILKFVKNTLDLSNNNLKAVTTNMFGYNIELANLILFNASIRNIDEKAFFGFVVDILNISTNFVTELKNYTFENSIITTLDISKCLIQKIQVNAFFGLDLRKFLDLSNNQISHIMKNTFQNLSSVQTIDLSFNFLKTLENNLFFNCKELTILNLSNLKTEIIRSNAFAGTYKLAELHLQNNFIEKINFQTVNVRGILNLQNNTISNVDFSFLNNSSVRFLLLSNNKIGNLVNNSVSITSLVKEIDLSNSHICSIDNNTFRGLASLKFLNLSNNCLGKIVSGAFVPLKKIVHLDLKGNKITSFSQNAFAFGNRLNQLSVTFFETNLTSNTFITFNYLRKLDISHSRITQLEENCFRGLIHLQNLYLYDVEIKEIVPGAFNGLNNLQSADFRIFFKNVDTIKSGTFNGLPKLDVLDLTNLTLTTIETKAFVGLSNLRKLFLNHNKLKIIANNTFSGLTSLKTLNLSHNCISTLEPSAFSGLNNLHDLSLSSNNLTKVALGTFQQFPNLQILSLRKNKMNKLVTGIFSNLKFLVHLDLSYNNITKIKMQNLMPLTNLEHLDLTGNNLIQMSHLDLIKSLRRLEVVEINGNKWKCDNLASMLIAFQNYSISWVSSKSLTFEHENIDGIKCYDICKFFYCVDEEEILFAG